MDNDTIQLEEKFRALPREMKILLTSPATAQTVREIGETHDLKPDQQSILFDRTADVLLGILSSESFADTLSHEAGLDHDVARSITKELYPQIFSKIQSTTQDSADQEAAVPIKNSNLSPLEQAGGFEIEHDIPLDGEDTLKGANARGFSAFSSGDRADMMSGIEDPAPAPVAPKTTMTEPLVDQLLRAAGVSPAQRPPEGKIDHAPLQAPKAPQPPANLPTSSDPYKEALK